MSKYPKAIDPAMVGEYPALAKSGAGYFFDEVLEYRVWFHGKSGAVDEFEGEDCFYTFETFEEAKTFADDTPGAEHPLALVRQKEWVYEPELGQFVHEKGERIAEWLPEWLERGARQAGDIEKFLQEKSTLDKAAN